MNNAMNSANSDSNIDSMRLLRNGQALAPSNVNDSGNVPNLQTVQTSSGEDQQSHSSCNDSTVGNSDDDLRTALSELMIQNRLERCWNVGLLSVCCWNAYHNNKTIIIRYQLIRVSTRLRLLTLAMDILL